MVISEPVPVASLSITIPLLPALFVVVPVTVNVLPGAIVNTLPELTTRLLSIVKSPFNETPEALSIVKYFIASEAKASAGIV